MPIVHSMKCIFIHIPKAGGTSITDILKGRSRPTYLGSIMRKYRGLGPDVELFGAIAGPDDPKFRPRDFENDRPQRLAHHWPADAVRFVVGDEIWDEYLKFCVVRNPWDRLVSFYEYARQTGMRGGTEGRNFVEWVNFRGFRPRLLPYITMPDGELGVDVIIRYENYVEEVMELFHRLGVRLELNDVPHAKKTERRHYRDYYTTELAETIYQELRAEIEFFGYEF